MFFPRVRIAAAVLAGLGAIGWVDAAAQGPGVAGRAAAAVPGAGGPRLSPAAAAVARYVKARRPGELNWQKIPWLADLPEAFRQAKAENRPVLLWATDDDPLDRC
jgi:hypothetical protein